MLFDATYNYKRLTIAMYRTSRNYSRWDTMDKQREGQDEKKEKEKRRKN